MSPSPSRWQRTRRRLAPPSLVDTVGVARDPLAFLRRETARRGPVFRLRLPTRALLVVSGVEANRLFTTEGRDALSAEAFWGALAVHNDSPHFILAVEGDAHKRLRKLFGPDLSQRGVQQFSDELAALLGRSAAETEGAPVSLQRFARQLVSRQAHLLLTRGSPGVDDAALEAVLESFRFESNALLLGKWPRAALRAPAYQRHRARADALIASLVPRLASDTEGWFASIARGRREQPELFTPGDVRLNMKMPFILGVDTVGSTLAFLWRELMQRPALAARLRDGVDAVFDQHGSTLPPLNALRDVTPLRGAVLETLRLYPAAFGVYRRATRGFRFADHDIAAGTDVLLFTTAPHVDPALFPEPYRFDVDRYAPPIDAHRQKFAFAPYGVGPHVCLGAGLGEAMLLHTTALMLRTLRPTLDKPSRRYGAVYDPSLSLDPRCRVRLNPRPAR